MGNQLEHLDGFDTTQTADIILSSLNGIDRSQKRVCKITILVESGEEFPLLVIIPSDSIPKPPPKSIECFKKSKR